MIPPSIIQHNDELSGKHKLLMILFFASVSLGCASAKYHWYCILGTVLFSTACYGALLWSLMLDIRKSKTSN